MTGDREETLDDDDRFGSYEDEVEAMEEVQDEDQEAEEAAEGQANEEQGSGTIEATTTTTTTDSNAPAAVTTTERMTTTAMANNDHNSEIHDEAAVSQSRDETDEDEEEDTIIDEEEEEEPTTGTRADAQGAEDEDTNVTIDEVEAVEVDEEEDDVDAVEEKYSHIESEGKGASDQIENTAQNDPSGKSTRIEEGTENLAKDDDETVEIIADEETAVTKTIPTTTGNDNNDEVALEVEKNEPLTTASDEGEEEVDEATFMETQDDDDNVVIANVSNKNDVVIPASGNNTPSSTTSVAGTEDGEVEVNVTEVAAEQDGKEQVEEGGEKEEVVVMDMIDQDRPGGEEEALIDNDAAAIDNYSEGGEEAGGVDEEEEKEENETEITDIQERTAKQTSHLLLRTTLLSEIEKKYSTLQKNHAQLQSSSSHQQEHIVQLTQQMDIVQDKLLQYQNDVVNKSNLLQSESNKCSLAEKDLILHRQRMDRMSIESDALRQEISRLASSNNSLTKQLNQIETEAKKSSSSTIPLRFELSRTQKEIDSLSSHTKWLESELTAKTDQFTSLRTSQMKEITNLRTQYYEEQTNVQTLTSRLNSVQKQNDMLNNENAKLRHEVKEQKQQCMELGQSSHEEMEAERRVSRLHINKYEELKDRVSYYQKEVEHMKQLAIDAAKEQFVEKEQLLSNHANEMKEMRDEMEEKVTSLTSELNDERNAKVDAENRLQSRAQRRQQRSLVSDGSRGTANSIGGGRQGIAMVPFDDGAVSGNAHDGVLSEGMPLSLTDLLDRLADTEDELSEERGERRKLELYLNRIRLDIEVKTPIIRAQRREYELALKGQEVASARLADALADAEDNRRISEEVESELRLLRRDHDEIKKENEDLARQVQALLRSRTIPGSFVSGTSRRTLEVEEEQDGSDIVRFESVEELQTQNQRLLRDYRRLTGKVADLERQLDRDELRNSLNMAEETMSHLREERDCQNSLVAGIVQQRDLYRALLAKADSTHFTYKGDESSRDNRELAIIVAGATTSPLRNSTSEAVTEELAKFRAEVISARAEKVGLEERVSRLDMHCSELTATADKMRNELISVEGGKARSEAEAAFLKNRCERLEGRGEEARAESKRMLQLHKDTQKRCSDLEESLAKSRILEANVEQQLRQAEAKLRLSQAQLETARKSEERLSIEAEALRSDVQRQGDLLGSIQRIEASLQARSSQEKDDQGAEIERLTNWLATEKSKSAAEREKLESQVDELEMKVNLLSNDRDDALRDVLHSKRDLVEAKREALNAKTECDKIVQQAHSLRANIDRLEAQKSQSVSPALNSGSGKEEQILSLTAELEASKSDLSTVKERVATYQAIAKAHETALNELREASGRLKKDQDVEIDRLRKELSIERRGSEAKQVALDELGDELSSQRGRQETTITDHKSRLTSLTTALEKTQKDAEAAETKLASVTAEVNSHKADASAAQNNYERELALHASARGEMAKTREERDREVGLRTSLQADVSNAALELKESRIQWEEVKHRIESAAKEVEGRLKEARGQNELLHRQVEGLAKTVEQMRDGTGEDAFVAEGAPSLEFEAQNDIISLRNKEKELREVIRFLRSERELQDAQLDSVKRTAERERSTVKITKRSLDEARSEITVLQSAMDKLDTFESGGQAHGEAKARIKQLEEQLVLLKESNGMLREEVDRLSSKLSSTSTELDECKQSVQPTRKRMRDTEDDNAALKAEKASLAREVDAWKGRVQTLVTKFHPIDPEEHRQALSQLGEIEHKFESQKIEVTKMEQENNAAKELVQRLNREGAQQKARIAVLTKAVSRANLEKDALAKSTSDASSETVKELDQLRVESKGRDAEITTLKTELESSEKRVENFKKMLSRFRTHVTDLTKKHADAVVVQKDAERAQKEAEKRVEELKVAEREWKAHFPAAAQPIIVDPVQTKGSIERNDPLEVVVEKTSQLRQTGDEPEEQDATPIESDILDPIPEGGFKYAPSASKVHDTFVPDKSDEDAAKNEDFTGASADAGGPQQEEDATPDTRKVDSMKDQDISNKSLGDNAPKGTEGIVSDESGKPNGSTGNEAGKQEGNLLDVPVSAATGEASTAIPKPSTENSMRAKLLERKRLLAEKIKQSKSSGGETSSGLAAESAVSDADLNKAAVNETELQTNEEPSRSQKASADVPLKRDSLDTKSDAPTVLSVVGMAGGSKTGNKTTSDPPLAVVEVSKSQLKSKNEDNTSSSITFPKPTYGTSNPFGTLNPPSQSAPQFSFGSSLHITLPVPSRKDIPGRAPPNSPFGMFGSALHSGSPSTRPLPLFGDSSTIRKRPLLGEDLASGGREQVKQARLESEESKAATAKESSGDAKKVVIEGPASDDGEINEGDDDEEGEITEE